jgi:clan AA aspartic protease
MSLVRAEVKLSNPRDQTLAALSVSALVATGAVHLCVPEHVAIQLGSREIEQREVTLAHGKRKLCAYCGPVQIEFSGRRCFTGVLVLGDEVLLGAIPLEDMDLVIHPGSRQLTSNPLSPNIPSASAKGVRKKPKRMT